MNILTVIVYDNPQENYHLSTERKRELRSPFCFSEGLSFKQRKSVVTRLVAPAESKEVAIRRKSLLETKTFGFLKLHFQV